MATVGCPECNLIFKTNDDRPRCPSCGWAGTWKPEPDPDLEKSREKVYSHEVWSHI
jgi:hypothetical protein